ncbi:hypothetical protein [Nocardia sp. NPDC059229]|uniref:hypothetical protein n=1 Tax=Nocardia sp. NPDC059229 TaxID=3346778 RepID=UPI0036B8B70F
MHELFEHHQRRLDAVLDRAPVGFKHRPVGSFQVNSTGSELPLERKKPQVADLCRRAGLLPKLLDMVRAAGAEAVFVPSAVHFDGGEVPARLVR